MLILNYRIRNITKNLLTSVQEVTLLSENPCIVILTGWEELKPAARSPDLSPANQDERGSSEIRKVPPILIFSNLILSREVQI